MLLAIVAHRAFLAFSTGFPINDGGLFYVFVQSIAEVFPGLPSEISYNGLTIPFAYPPLAFWLGGLVSRLGADPLTVVHLMPVAMNLIYVALFALLLIRSGRSALFVAVTLLFLSTQVRSFEWLVMGGGLSRGLGSLFLILTLLAVGVPRTGVRNQLSTGRLILAGAAVGGAILSHLEWGINATACVILSRALAGKDVKDFVRSNIVAGLTALVVILPWLAFVYRTNGFEPLLAASGTSPWQLSSYAEHLIGLFRVSLANLMIPIGLAVLVARRELFWPLFLALCFLLTPRHAPTPASLALAFLAAQGAFWVAGRLLKLSSRPAIGYAVATILILILALAPINSGLIARGETVRPLNRNEREAMAWVAAEHPGEDFVVLTNLPWWYDRSAEWFPVVARATSVNTLQGREWLPDNAYGRWFDNDMAIKTSDDCKAMLQEMATRLQPAKYLWVQWRTECFRKPDYRPVYTNESVTIFERLAP